MQWRDDGVRRAGTLVRPQGVSLISETHRGQQWTPALTLPQVRYGLSLLLLEVFCPPGVPSICRHVQRQLMRNELARFYHYRTRKCLPSRKSDTPRRAGGLMSRAASKAAGCHLPTQTA
jgi:hypothetical protein